MQAYWPANLWEFIARNWAAVAIAATCLSVLAWIALVLNKYVRICLNIFVSTPPPPGLNGRPEYERILGEKVRFRAFDGVSLRGMWLWADRPRGTILFAHEYGSDMHSFARYVRPLMRAHFNIFTFDFRGHGASGCPNGYKPLQWPSDKELGDVLGAVAYATGRLAERGQPAKVGLLGISRGGSAGILAADTDERIGAIACDGAFSTDEVCISMMKRWASIFAKIRVAYENHPDLFWRMMFRVLLCRAHRRMKCRYPSVRRAVRTMTSRPILLIHGARDSYVQVEQTQALHRAASRPKYLWIVPAARHNQAVDMDPAAYAQRTVAFFTKHLAGEAVDDERISGPPPADTDRPPGQSARGAG